MLTSCFWYLDIGSQDFRSPSADEISCTVIIQKLLWKFTSSSSSCLVFYYYLSDIRYILLLLALTHHRSCIRSGAVLVNPTNGSNGKGSIRNSMPKNHSLYLYTKNKVSQRCRSIKLFIDNSYRSNASYYPGSFI